jgi:hypothetical protein
MSPTTLCDQLLRPYIHVLATMRKGQGVSYLWALFSPSWEPTACLRVSGLLSYAESSHGPRVVFAPRTCCHAPPPV